MRYPTHLGQLTIEEDANILKTLLDVGSVFVMTDPLYTYTLLPYATNAYEIGSATEYYKEGWFLALQIGDDPSDYQGSIWGSGSLTRPQLEFSSAQPSVSAASNFSLIVLEAPSYGGTEDAVLYLSGGDENAVDVPYVELKAGSSTLNFTETTGTLTDAPFHVNQDASAGAAPVLHLEQDDVSEEFIRFTGQAASAVLTQSLVDDGDVTTPTLVGWMKVNVQDEGNQITDGAYFVPFYSLA